MTRSFGAKENLVMYAAPPHTPLWILGKAIKKEKIGRTKSERKPRGNSFVNFVKRPNQLVHWLFDLEGKQLVGQTTSFYTFGSRKMISCFRSASASSSRTDQNNICVFSLISRQTGKKGTGERKCDGFCNQIIIPI